VDAAQEDDAHPHRTAKARRHSAGVLVYRRTGDRPTGPGTQVLLGHMGGPFWVRRDAGAWSIPKGGYTPDEDAFTAACREYVEEVGLPLPPGPFLELGDVLQTNNKVVTAWAVEGDLDPADSVSSTFELEWPQGSGRRQSFPEFDRVDWFDLDAARDRIVVAQVAFIHRLEQRLRPGPVGP
jgi:predicted NUDIX family NTP pyrophosphohydrolase